MADDDKVDGEFNLGDWVECKLDEGLIGIVVNYDARGKISVQLAGCLCVREFYIETLRHYDPDDELPGGEEDMPTEAKVDNVVRVDFSNKRALRKIRGAA